MGDGLLGLDPLRQVSFLLTVWWYGVNWLVAYPYEGMGDALPPSFNAVTLARLRALPVSSATAFEAFADRLIEATGLSWLAADHSSARMLLRGSIERMVVQVLADFGAVEREYGEEPLRTSKTSRLVAMEITPLGRALLDAVANNQ